MQTSSGSCTKPESVRYYGELWLPLYCFTSMATVLVCEHTTEGFVVASDGREVSTKDNRVVNDDARKIFVAEHPGVQLAYCLAGTITFAVEDRYFDFRKETGRVAREISLNQPKNWFAYVTALMNGLHEPLEAIRKSVRT